MACNAELERLHRELDEARQRLAELERQCWAYSLAGTDMPAELSIADTIAESRRRFGDRAAVVMLMGEQGPTCEHITHATCHHCGKTYDQRQAEKRKAA